MKIHISLETKILLDSIGGYILEPRGLIMVDVSQNYLYCQNIIEMISALKIILFFDQGHDQRETFWLTGDK